MCNTEFYRKKDYRNLFFPVEKGLPNNFEEYLTHPELLRKTIKIFTDYPKFGVMYPKSLQALQIKLLELNDSSEEPRDLQIINKLAQLHINQWEVWERDSCNPGYFEKCFKACGYEANLADDLVRYLKNSENGLNRSERIDQLNDYHFALNETGLPPNNVEEIQNQLGNQLKIFVKLFVSYDNDPNSMERLVSYCLEHEVNEGFLAIAEATKWELSEVHEINSRCNENGELFAQLFKLYDSDQSLIEKIINHLTNSDYPKAFTDIALVTKFEMDTVERITTELGDLSQYFPKLYKEFRADSSLTDEIVSCLQNTKNIEEFMSAAMAVPLHPKLLLILQELSPYSFRDELVQAADLSSWCFKYGKTKLPLSERLLQSLAEHPFALSGPMLMDTYLQSAECQDIINALKKSRNIQEFFIYLSVDSNFDADTLEQLVPLEECQDYWECYVVRRNGWAKDLNYGEDDSQINYGSLMHQSIRMASLAVDQYGLNLDQLLSFIAFRRAEIATVVGHGSAKKFGRPIQVLNYTHCRGHYQELDSWFKHLQNEPEPIPFYRKNQIELIEGMGTPPVGAECGSITATIGEKELTLSQVVFDLNKENHSIIIHCNYKNHKPILGHIRTLYDAAMLESDETRICELMGEIFWWICQAKFWERGDPSIAELLVKTVFYQKGIPLLPWKPELVPWCAVMKELDVNEFGRKFHTLFDEEFSKSQGI
jgi:Avirulence protein